jgi:hypothetical protein
MANNNSTIWARPSVIVALSGLSDRRVRRDIMRYHVPSKKRRESPLRPVGTPNSVTQTKGCAVGLRVACCSSDEPGWSDGVRQSSC